MSYKDLKLKHSYESTKDNLLEDFYIPMLKETKKYCRMAGFFNSSALLIASKGIEGLISNGGEMKLLISPNISQEDFEVLKYVKSIDDPRLKIIKELSLDDFKKFDNLQALAWMLANNKLEIKIVVNKSSCDSIFHQKVGIGIDNENNMLSFSGSINETASAWLFNIEEFKTFRSWSDDSETKYLESDREKFIAYWRNMKEDVARVFDLPTALKEKIISIAPKDKKDLLLMQKYRQKKLYDSNYLNLFPHQEQAVKKWEENKRRLLVEMATGTGKTRVAIGCFATLLNKEENVLIIVATPKYELSNQWEKEIKELGIDLDCSKFIDGNNRSWENDLKITLLDLYNTKYKNTIIYSTHAIVSKKGFIDLIKRYKKDIKILFIVDEVHGIASEQQKKALLGCYDYRLGLTATPQRMFDEEGTELIRQYFGENSFVFSIADALNTINPLTGKPFLNHFNYYPVFVDLTDNEKSDYINKTKSIIYCRNKLESEKDKDEIKNLNEKIKNLSIKRANILKSAKNKLAKVKKLLNNFNGKIKDCIIFTSPKHMEKMMNFLHDIGISRAKITEKEKISEREDVIKKFKSGDLQVLLGIECLNEGIDIKNASIAVLMSSSINPREYIQRIGRVIRPAPNKNLSQIYDLVVKPIDFEKTENISESILIKEARRALLIAKNADNYSEIKNIFINEGVEINND